MEKQCSMCSETKPLSEFYRRTRHYLYRTESARHSSSCKECCRAKSRSNPNRTQNQKNAYKRKPEYFQFYQKRKYGFKTLEEYQKFKTERGNCCEICAAIQTKASNALAVDHNHVTGSVRGLLCHMCNKALGALRVDSRGTEFLTKAIAYIQATDNKRTALSVVGGN